VQGTLVLRELADGAAQQNSENARRRAPRLGGAARGRRRRTAAAAWAASARYYLVTGRGRIVLRLRHLRLDFSVMASLLRVSAGGVLQFVATSSYIVLMRIVAAYGSAGVAG
jgi:hypothetical protein